MNKTILVIGSVTAKQYACVRLQTLREGTKAKIVRASKEEIALGKEELISRYGSDDGTVLEYYSPEWMSLCERAGMGPEVVESAVSRYLAQFGDIVAVVVADDCYDMIGLHGCNVGRYAGVVFESVPLWHVHSDDFIEYIAPVLF